MKTNKQQSLMLRSFDVDLNEKEQELLSALLDSSPQARLEFDELATVRETVAALPGVTFGDGFADRVISKIQSPDFGTTKSMVRIYSLHSGRLLRAAAIILLLVGISALIWLQPRSYTAPSDRQVSRMLPDGSTVLLSRGATLSYKAFWGRSERKVALNGEAFFDVTSGSKPFIVETFNSEVRVLGTRFNVRAWPGHEARYTSVLLEEGRLEVTARNDPDDVHLLMPEESIIIARDTTFPKKSLKLPAEIQRNGQRGGLTFDDELLIDVVTELGRRYNMRLSLAGDLGLERITYLRPRQASIDTVLAEICRPRSLAFRKTANGYELFAP